MVSDKWISQLFVLFKHYTVLHFKNISFIMSLFFLGIFISVVLALVWPIKHLYLNWCQLFPDYKRIWYNILIKGKRNKGNNFKTYTNNPRNDRHQWLSINYLLYLYQTHFLLNSHRLPSNLFDQSLSKLFTHCLN